MMTNPNQAAGERDPYTDDYATTWVAMIWEGWQLRASIAKPPTEQKCERCDVSEEYKEFKTLPQMYDELVSENAELRKERDDLRQRLARQVSHDNVIAPIIPTAKMLDVAVSYALNVSVHGEGGWSKYMANIYQRMIEVIPQPCLLYTSPSPRDRTRSRMPSSA